MNYTYEKLLKNLGFKRLDESYDTSFSSFKTYLDHVDTSSFLSKSYLDSFKDLCDLDNDAYNVLLSHLDLFNKNEELIITSYFLKYLLFYFKDPSLNNIFKSPKCSLYKNNIFELFVLISIVLERVNYLKNKSMDDSILKPRLFKIKRIVEHHLNKDFHNFRWASFDFYINLFDIDHLSFMIPYIFDTDVHIFRNKETKDVMILAGANIRVRKDGQIDNVNGIKDFAFKTKYKEYKTFFSGNLIKKKGIITSDIIKLKKSEWEEYIKEGDYILEMHVGSKYKYEDNIIAFKKAYDFAKKYFKEYEFKAIYGYSWLFSPQIPDLIKNEDSNILKMFKSGYIVPVTSGDSLAFDFIYGKEKMDINEMPTNTSLLKSIKDYYLKGGRINCGAYFLTIDKLKEK